MRTKAYTTIEIVIVLAILMAIALILIPITVSGITKTNANNYLKDISSRLFDQQIASYSGKNSSAHGIAFEQEKAILFTGTSLIAATDTVDLVYPTRLSLQQTDLVGGTDQIVFLEGNYRPVAYGSVSLTDGDQIYRLEINSEGMIDYYVSD
ncbi:MAG: hypothetical protein UZ20_WS6002000718 [candidate division WS6 bacterium OLB21]|uniref:Prepilin-type N-terminal cleavage/methylation domain-containing protein n=2 Tax=Candidatus Dojkabacteria TaxID=74243 RepID=A0A136KH28_9BACT|nr:MAG: hypothetical protein UZ20_WS6002000718 [candidate division WS6 bacterium OLB21]